jgi:fructokinase
MSIDILCLGELLVDMFPAELGRRLADVSAFHPKPGGAPANVAVAAARLGLRSAFIGKVGEDAFGRHLARVLAHEGVDVRGLCFDQEARTTLAFIAMPDPNHAEFVFYRNPGADLRLRPEDLKPEQFTGLRAFHCGSVSLVDEPARSATLAGIQMARGVGALVSFDVNYRPSLWGSPEEALACINQVAPQADLLKVNEVELKLLSGSDELEPASRSLLELGPALVVVTLGEQGSFYCARGACGFVPAFRVKTVDAVGCGDAFIAGLLSRLVSQTDWHDLLTPTGLYAALHYANAVGALTATQLGVIPALPTADQVDLFLKNNL